MSVNVNAIDTFIDVIKAQEDLIINGGLLADLRELGDELPEEDEKIVSKILEWLKADESRSELYQAYLSELEAQPPIIDLYEQTQMFGHDEDEEKIDRPRRRKPLLQNSIANIGNKAVNKDNNSNNKQQ
jgi:hypothetical protein